MPGVAVLSHFVISLGITARWWRGAFDPMYKMLVIYNIAYVRYGRTIYTHHSPETGSKAALSIHNDHREHQRAVMFRELICDRDTYSTSTAFGQIARTIRKLEASRRDCCLRCQRYHLLWHHRPATQNIRYRYSVANLRSVWKRNTMNVSTDQWHQSNPGSLVPIDEALDYRWML